MLTTRRQFAIRPTIRNHQAMKRDNIIKRVADLVGKPHTVDLTHYNRLILVDVYRVGVSSSLLHRDGACSMGHKLRAIIQNILGMSIVDGDYEKFKRYNLAEIYEPTPQKSEA